MEEKKLRRHEKKMKWRPLRTNNHAILYEFFMFMDGFVDAGYSNEDVPGIPLSSIQNQEVFFPDTITAGQAIEILTNGGCGD